MVGHGLASASPSLPADIGTGGGGQSFGELAVARPFDLHRFRAMFPTRWAAFLKAHFRSTAEIAAFFDVDDKTARNWVEGSTKPTAPTALIAVARIPGAMAELIGVAA